MSNDLLRRAITVGRTQGWVWVLKRAYAYCWGKLVSTLGGAAYGVNTKRYWDFRIRHDWSVVGGGEQTRLFAASLFANTDVAACEDVRSVLDFGCATGDASPYLRLFFPKARIYLHDLSSVGVEKAVRTYGRYLGVQPWDGVSPVDFVYCSNVIEHAADPRALVETLVNASQRYICIQCPWEERRPDGSPISPDTPHGEHIWTVDDAFYEKYIRHDRVEWRKFVGEVPIAWEGGRQVYFVGKLS